MGCKMTAALIYDEREDEKNGKALKILGEEEYGKYAKLPLALASAAKSDQALGKRLQDDCLRDGEIDLMELIGWLGEWAESIGYGTRLGSVTVITAYGGQRHSQEAIGARLCWQDRDDYWLPEIVLEDSMVDIVISKPEKSFNGGYFVSFVAASDDDSLIDRAIAIYPEIGDEA